jgi:hypothetical protein
VIVAQKPADRRVKRGLELHGVDVEPHEIPHQRAGRRFRLGRLRGIQRADKEQHHRSDDEYAPIAQPTWMADHQVPFHKETMVDGECGLGRRM